jgi:hypothetical protein
MKKQVIGAIAIVATGLLTAALNEGYKALNLDPVDMDLNRRVCIETVKKSTEQFVDINYYELSERAQKKVDLVISQQCKVSVYKANGESVHEPKTLKTAGNMFIDGLDYEEAQAVRYGKRRAEFTGSTIGAMGVKEVTAWMENFQDFNK